MHELQHCCVESDLDTLMGRLPLFMRVNVSGILLECFVWTEALNAFATHQFQYLDGKMSSNDTEEDKTFHLRLEHLYERFYRTRRDEIIESAVDRFLSNDLMLALMGPISEELVPDRREELQLAFSLIEEWMYKDLFTSTGQIEYNWLKGLPRTFSSKEQMTAHQLHLRTGRENTSLDGHEVIMVTCPSPVINWLVGKNGRLMDVPLASQILVMDDGKNKWVYKNNSLQWDTDA
ncbi:hypothetical protein N7493_001145 [Penicillium malachiteum]|uniref:Uncharacterized protein n=1 Tax=Penicillium malachiteum TaxID=1324776 RepID=A0AAD6HUL0_9EURO|nr:hypothetical protein N7493_001145 [Penicillium malachiteum]